MSWKDELTRLCWRHNVGGHPKPQKLRTSRKRLNVCLRREYQMFLKRRIASFPDLLRTLTVAARPLHSVLIRAPWLGSLSGQTCEEQEGTVPSGCGLWSSFVLAVVLDGALAQLASIDPTLVRIDSGTLNLTEE
jgi:hypothetical protein